MRRGAKKATVAIAHQILVIAYYLLTKNETYKEYGSAHHEKKLVEAKKKKALKYLENLGFEVTLNTKPA